MKPRLRTLWNDNKSLLLFLLLMTVFRSAVADWNDVPSGSMEPTIIVGDRLLINKMAYDIRVPFTTVSLHHRADPQRGEIVIFESKVAANRLVKRVIGVPGDEVSMTNNRLTVNGKPLRYSASEQPGEFIETLGNQNYTVKIHDTNERHANFATVTVPDGHYLVLGDNRDNSADSRFIGFVPRGEMIGRSRQLALSLDYENYYLPRTERFFHQL
jgi:signal peptidase I